MTAPNEQTASLDYEPETAEDWLDEPEQLPPRPRRKLLAPIPAALLVLLLIALGFFAGVEVEKGQSSSSTNGGLPAGLAALRGAGGVPSSSTRTPAGGAANGPAGGGFFGAGGPSGGLTTGEVSYVSGNTLYVSSGETTVKVTAPKGTKVSKTVSASTHSIHPGDTVIVRGAKGANGSVTASSISVGSAVSGTGQGGSSEPGGGGATQQLFGSR
jgi:hypothetical protein